MIDFLDKWSQSANTVIINGTLYNWRAGIGRLWGIVQRCSWTGMSVWRRHDTNTWRIGQSEKLPRSSVAFPLGRQSGEQCGGDVADQVNFKETKTRWFFSALLAIHFSDTCCPNYKIRCIAKTAVSNRPLQSTVLKGRWLGVNFIGNVHIDRPSLRQKVARKICRDLNRCLVYLCAVSANWWVLIFVSFFFEFCVRFRFPAYWNCFSSSEKVT